MVNYNFERKKITYKLRIKKKIIIIKNYIFR